MASVGDRQLRATCLRALALGRGPADVVLYGTGADEKRVGPDQVRAQVARDWAQSDSVALSLGWISVSAAGQAEGRSF